MKILKSLVSIQAINLTIKRFPLSVLCSIALFAIYILEVNNIFDLNEHRDFISRFSVMLICGYFWFGADQIFFEAQKFTKPIRALLTALGAFFIIYVVGFTGEWQSSALFILPALLLTIMIAPYINTKKDKSDDFSFWAYNKEVWSGAALAIIAGMVLGGGLAIAIGSINYLFEVKMNHDLSSHIFMFAMIVFAPIYALSFVPKTFVSDEPDECPSKAVSFLVNYILAPLGVLYLVILYAYFIKIVFAWELPRGQLSYMICGLAGLGIATYLIGWPLRKTGTKLLRFLYKWFFPAMIVPAILQSISIYERINQYGVTEQRYFIAATAFWLVVVAVYFSFKKVQLKTFPTVLAFLLLFASFGPWGASSISGLSQIARLKSMLTEHGGLQGGQITKINDLTSLDDKKSISSVIKYLDNTNRLSSFLKTDDMKCQSKKQRRYNTPPNKDHLINCEDLYHKKLGIKRNVRWAYEGEEKRINFNANKIAPSLNVAGYDYLIDPSRANGKSYKEKLVDYQTGKTIISKIIDSGLTIEGDEVGQFKFDLSNWITKTSKTWDSGSNQEPKWIVQENDKAKIQLIITYIRGEYKDDNLKIADIRYTYYLKLK